MRQGSDLFCSHKCVCLPVCLSVYSCACFQGQAKWRCIISNHSEHGHCSSQARQSDHLRGCLVFGLWPKASCLLLYVSLPPSLSSNAPLQHTQNPWQPWPSPLISSLLTLPLLSTTPASCPLPPRGEKKDKVTEINIEKWKWKRGRETEGAETNHLIWTLAPGRLRWEAR